MNFTTAQQIVYGAVMAMPDMTIEARREWNEKAKRENERNQEIGKLSDHYFKHGFTFGDFLEALEECDQQNRERIMQLLRMKDDAEFGLQVRQVFEAYCWTYAEGEV